MFTGGEKLKAARARVEKLQKDVSDGEIEVSKKTVQASSDSWASLEIQGFDLSIPRYHYEPSPTLI
jgi:hypothetical protein